MKPHEVITALGQYVHAVRSGDSPTEAVASTAAAIKVEIVGKLIDMSQELESAKHLLRRLAHEAWMRQDFKTNAEICALLGEKSALEHELGEDKP